MEPRVPQQRQDGFNPQTSAALIGLAGTGALMGVLPGLPLAPSPMGLAPLPLFAAFLWLRLRREGRVALRLRRLRLHVALPATPAGMPEQALAFRAVETGCWQAQHGGWQVELRQGSGALAWQLVLTRLHGAEPPMPLVGAATLDALLRLGRGLLPRMGEPGLAALLDRDFHFPLAGASEITMLAEGGYALREGEACRAIAAEMAEGLIRRGKAVPAASC